MLSPLWWIPLAIAAAAIVPLWRGARRLTEEAARVQTAIAELRLVRPVVAAVTAEIAAVSATASSAAATDHDFGHR